MYCIRASRECRLYYRSDKLLWESTVLIANSTPVNSKYLCESVDQRMRNDVDFDILTFYITSSPVSAVNESFFAQLVQTLVCCRCSTVTEFGHAVVVCWFIPGVEFSELTPD